MIKFFAEPSLFGIFKSHAQSNFAQLFFRCGKIFSRLCHKTNACNFLDAEPHEFLFLERDEILSELREGKALPWIAYQRGLTLEAVCALRNEALVQGELKTEDLWKEDNSKSQ